MNLTSTPQSFELNPPVDHSESTTPQGENPNCVHKHCGGSGESNQFLLLAGNAATQVDSGFIFPPLLEKLLTTPPDSLCTQSFFQWDDRTPEEVDLTDFRVEAWYYTEDWSEKRLRTVLAFINKVLYHWGLGVGAIVEDGGRRVSKAVARTAIYSRSILLCALSSAADYIRNLWGHAFSDRSLYTWVEDLRRDGFLDYAGEMGTGKKSRQWLLSVPDLLLLAEACEKRILALTRLRETDADDYGFEWDELPMHHGFTLKLLFDAVFPGFGWNRKGNDTQTEPTTYAETDRCQEDEPDHNWEALQGIRGMVLAVGGWTDEIAAHCDRIASRLGPSWGVEAVYERIARRWDARTMQEFYGEVSA